jgi:hypothetical protein
MAVASYDKGSTFRFYKEDETHYTAVQIKDNKILQVKNPEGNEKKIYESLTEWLEAIGAKEDQLKIETVRTKGETATAGSTEKAKDKPRVGKTTDGFIIPRDKTINLNKWFRWVYKIIKEAAPELLASEEVKNAYNNLVEICLKDSDIQSDYYLRGKMPCYHELLSYHPGSPRNAWGGIDGFKVFFNSERYGKDPYSTRSEYYYKNYLPEKKEKSVYDAAGNEIAAAYKSLFELIYKPIHKHINKINDKKRLVANIATTKKRIANAEKVISRITARYAQSLNLDRAALERYEKELKDLD